MTWTFERMEREVWKVPHSSDPVPLSAQDIFEKIERERDVLRLALSLACARIADGPQTYSEANTPEGWAEVYIKEAENYGK